RQIMRKISSWWNIDYSEVNSYEEWQVWLVSIRIQSKLKGVLEGVYYGSTMESEFVALAAAGKEAEWLRNLIH
ncbi:hypothetical protein Tco_1382036, partial [Tanacetum coccineum]